MLINHDMGHIVVINWLLRQDLTGITVNQEDGLCTEDTTMVSIMIM